MTKLEQAILDKQADFDLLVAQTITVAFELQQLREQHRITALDILNLRRKKKAERKAVTKLRVKAH